MRAPTKLLFAPDVARDAHGVRAKLWPKEPFACSCGRATYVAVNRDGTTRCEDCDELYVNTKPALK